MRIFRRFHIVWILGLLGMVGGLVPRAASAKPRPARSHKHILSRKDAESTILHKREMKRKLAGISGRMHVVRVKIHETKAKEHRIGESIQTVQSRLNTTRRNISRTDARLEQLSERHRLLVRRLAQTQQRLKVRRVLLGRRIRENYERGHTSYAQVLIASRSLHELLSRSYYVRQVVTSDTQLIQTIKADEKQVIADKQELEAQTRETKSLQAEYEAQKQQLASDMSEKQSLLANVVQTRQEAEGELDGMEEEANAMTDRIRVLSEALQVRREAMERAEAEARQPHHPHSGYRPAPAIEHLPSVWHGGFIRPCAGPVTSGFGYRYHPILHTRRMHTGVDFGGGYGAPIHAAGGGVVIMAGYSRGYGNCVIIDHGGGTTTLYGHCSSLLVSDGQVVRQGQIIARIGATGMATGPHLHFEVRRNGAPVSPF